MKKGTRYSEAPGGPIQRAFALRLRGESYDSVARTLRAEFPECARLKVESVRSWARTAIGSSRGCGSRLAWDEIVAIIGREGDQQMIGAANPQAAKRLTEVRELIRRVNATILGQEGAFEQDKLDALKIRMDTFLVKLYEQERALTRSDLLAVPRRSIQRVVLLVLREMTQVFTELGLADKRKVQEAASRVADEVIRRMPDVLEEAAAQEAVDGS